MTKTIEIGIPVLERLDLALLKAQQLRERGFNEHIHISVNLGRGQQVAPIPANLGSLQISLHESDMGLYGNFKFLMESANSDLFAWVAIDDLPDVS